MDERPPDDEQAYSQQEQALFQREYDRVLQAELSSVREDEIKAHARRAAQQEITQRRDALRDTLDGEMEQANGANVDPRDEANREAPSKLLLGLILLLLLLFLLAVADRLPSFGNAASNARAAVAAGRQSRLEPKLAGPTATSIAPAGPTGATVQGDQGSDPEISELFAPYYAANDGYRVFGLPISPLLVHNGRQAQWFERARLEYFPDFRATPFEVEPALLGVEFTGDRQFPTQTFFNSRPGLRYFPETGHGVGDLFLDYWDANGGLAIFGYPISDVVIEVLPETGTSHSVQYFQRARFELHNRPDGTQEVKLGLLGRALYLQQGSSWAGAIAAPTDVPIP